MHGVMKNSPLANEKLIKELLKFFLNPAVMRNLVNYLIYY